MQQYIVQGEGASRVLMVLAASAHRFRFFNLTQEELEPIKFKRAGSRLLAVVGEYVMVYKLPNAHEYHREYMQHNARAMWCGMQADPDRLLDNMLEYVETI